MDVLRLRDIGTRPLADLLERYGLALELVLPDAPIPGSYWGAPEAGLVGSTVYARPDTPVHSVLHEAAHVVCMSPDRRHALEKDAGGDDLEESAVCYLQLVLSESALGLSRTRAFRDMDAWGYSFRRGSTRAWFESDAEDARAWLVARGLLTPELAPSFRLRGRDPVPA